MQKLGWFGGLGVIQGCRKHSHSIEHIRLPIRLFAIAECDCERSYSDNVSSKQLLAV